MLKCGRLLFIRGPNSTAKIYFRHLIWNVDVRLTPLCIACQRIHNYKWQTVTIGNLILQKWHKTTKIVGGIEMKSAIPFQFRWIPSCNSNSNSNSTACNSNSNSNSNSGIEIGIAINSNSNSGIYPNPGCHRSQQSWHHDNYLVSATGA